MSASPAPAVGALDRVGEVRRHDRLDQSALETFCRLHLAGFRGPLLVAQFHGGASNPTYLLTDTASGRRFVLRKPPSGVLQSSAHAVDREHRIMAALKPTRVSVPPMLSFCADPAVIGAPFYLMPFIEGRVYRDNRLADMSPADRTSAYLSVARTLAALHAVDPASIGLADYGRPGNYFGRQIARWTRQYREAQTEAIPSMDRLMDGLAARAPVEDAAAIVHGDYRLENVMFAPDRPEVIAVLDWELSTLGHPLADLGFFCLFYHADFTPWGSAASIDFAATGIPEEQRFVADYCEAAGRDGVGDWSFLLSFSAFRLAAIAQGVHQRRLAADPEAQPVNGARDWATLSERLLHRTN